MSERSAPESETPVELLRSLAVFAEAPDEEHARLSDALGFERAPGASDYSDVFLFQVYPYASVHVGPEGMMGGEARARVAGFWTALGYTPPAEPDHLAALLGLLATLGAAEGTLEGAERRLAAQSRRALLDEHISPWVFAALHRIGELSPVYRPWADLLGAVLRAEVVRSRGSEAHPVPAETLPVHLRLAPALPDPRREGSDAFLSGLLSPVRSGMIVARADLAAISREAGLGLRAGERRYALEHLLAQSPAPVLHSLAVEARRQAALHDQRSGWLGDIAAFFAARCRATADLLDELARAEVAGASEPAPSDAAAPDAAATSGVP